MKIIAIFIFTLLSFLPAAYAQSDAEIKEVIIQQSVQSYPGSCACPYNKDRAGRKCGARSAYSRAGGYSVICYPSDVTDQMVSEFKEASRGVL